MSRRDDQKRKKRELKKKEARKAEEARRLERKRAARNAVVTVDEILERLKALFNEDSSKAIACALNEQLSEEEIAERLNVSPERVSELLDLAGRLPHEIVEYFRRFPQVMSNPEVLEAIIDGLKQRGLQG
ncbi:MAG: hypothetical protein RL518_1087 [Pseudomonadota bacterium]|jgi:hypothetical protein